MPMVGKDRGAMKHPKCLNSSLVLWFTVSFSFHLLQLHAFTEVSLPTKQWTPTQTAKITFYPNNHNRPIHVSSRSSSSPTKVLKMGGDDAEISGSDRLKACIPYILPILDGDKFGRFIYQRIPPLGALDQIAIQPVEQLYNSIPFLNFGLFLLLAVGTRNPGMNRSVRFNAQQAILIDILLIFPQIVGSILPNNLPMVIVETGTNFVFYAYSSAVLYSIVSNLFGKVPNQIPIISEAAEMSVGP